MSENGALRKRYSTEVVKAVEIAEAIIEKEIHEAHLKCEDFVLVDTANLGIFENKDDNFKQTVILALKELLGKSYTVDVYGTRLTFR